MKPLPHQVKFPSFPSRSMVDPSSGLSVHYSISPCSAMTPGYGLQVHLSLKEHGANSESVFLLRKGLALTDKNADMLVSEYLAANGTSELQRLAEEYSASLEEFSKLRESAAQLAVERHIKMRAKGYTHHTVAWIHPEQGSDQQVEFYSVGPPTAKDMKRVLRDSIEKTDFRTIELTSVVAAVATTPQPQEDTPPPAKRVRGPKP